MVRFSGVTARLTAGSTTPNVVQLIPSPTSTPRPMTSQRPDGASAAMQSPAAKATAPNATTGAGPRRSAIAPANGCANPQTRLCSAMANATSVTGTPRS